MCLVGTDVFTVGREVCSIAFRFFDLGMLGKRPRTLHPVGVVPALLRSLMPDVQRARLVGRLFFCRLLGGIIALTLILFGAISCSQFYSSGVVPMRNFKPWILVLNEAFKQFQNK